MGWQRRYKGKYVKVNKDSPSALGVCDQSGLLFNHKDLVKQMEWRGDRLVWTGFLVGKRFLDKPQEQHRPPPVKDDPKSIKDARFPGDYVDYESNPVDNAKVLSELNDFKWMGQN